MKKRRKSRAKTARPKGAFNLPTGGYVMESHHITTNGKHLRVRGVVRDEPDRVARVLLAIIRDELEHRDRSDG